MAQKKCEWCSVVFNKPKGRGREQFLKRKYCSKECSLLAKRPKEMTKTCEHCKITFKKRYKTTKKEWAFIRFCSSACANRGKANRKPIEDRFWKFVKKKTKGCWQWTGATGGLGYGHIATERGKSPIKAYRLSWEIHFGQIPDGLCVCHACDNPNCVNPDHLLLGTHQANITDMVAKNRQQRVSRCGEDGHTSLLTNLEAKEIRTKYATGEYTYTDLAKQYPVKTATIERVVRNESYKDDSYLYKYIGNSKPRPHRRKWFDIYMARKLRDKGFTLKRIAKVSGVSRSVVSQKLREYSI